jgi:hypothetical protein
MRVKRMNRKRWHPPEPLLPVAVFHCRRCRAALTRPLALLADAAALSLEEDTSLVPEGHYWPVVESQDFGGQFAVALTDLLGVGYHSDDRRLLGCCGPSGAFGPNRVCTSGHEVGTERADCVWSNAVYLDPSLVVGVAPGAFF